ncbi:hypothetical protein HYT52_00560 [Candidatus Woesearchaeota archaeon]|nr:hypothetical protein [Candidatus Woesearchaeota archaeon]
MDWYWHTESMDRLRKKFVEKVNVNRDYLQKLLREWHRRIERFNEVMRKIDHIKLSELSNHQLLSWYDRWYKTYIAEYGIAIGIQDGFSMRAEVFLIPELKDILARKGRMTIDEDILLLLSPVKESFITQEIRDRIVIRIKQDLGKDITKDLQQHIQKYHWLQNNYARDVCLDEDFFSRQLEEIKNPQQEHNKINTESTNIKEKKKDLVRELRLDQKTKNLIKITETFAYMQDERKKYVLLATHYERMFIEEIGRRVGLNLGEMEYTHYYEMKNILLGNLSPANVRKAGKERQKFCCVIFDMKGYDVIKGKDAEKLFDGLFKSDSVDVQELKGIVASPGKVQGRVKIVRKTHDLINVKSGDIIVASMTRPEMIVAMKKAKAIVTDEGGVTSHAAVVSRELGIPCIIGTKIATKVFKDGDIVEVDAVKGIVRVVKKN